jgi:hypothetical protein
MTDARRCTATSKRSGKRCQGAPIHGGTVCWKHGGAAPQVRRRAAERLADLIDPDRVLREAAMIAYADTRAAYNDDGTLRPISEWPAGLASAVASFEAVRGNIDEGDGKFDPMLKVRWCDKLRALDMLMRHLALYKDQLQLQLELKDPERIVERLTAGRMRVADERRAGADLQLVKVLPLPGRRET